MSFNVGENIGPYRIIEQLGQGGMATVYKAYHAALDRYVALKVLHPAFNQDQTFTARFQREARVVAKLEHSNIVPVYDYSEHEGRPYLVMKYIEGDTLKARLNEGPLTSGEIERVVNSVGYALEYAHQQGILHRDIKPSNVLISTDGTMYLADFGLARIAQAGESTMSSDSIMGTPQYISPEQAMGKKDLDAGTDIYSFGVMMYEMVVGQVPFSADTPFSIIHDHIYTPLPLPMDINPKVPEPVQRVLLKALAKDRADRYQSVEAMIDAFKAAWIEAGIPMQGTAITMRPASLREKTGASKNQQAEPAAKTVAAKPPAKKRSPWMWVGIGVMALLCCGVAFLAIRNRRLNPPVNQLPTNLPVSETIQPPTADNSSTTQFPGTPGIPPPNPPDVPPEVQAAKDLVSQNPGDPDAHLQLSYALWDSGDIQHGLEELRLAADLAGPANEKFFIHAAEGYKEREAWIPAAGMYLRLVPIYRTKDMPPELANNLKESAYKAAQEKNLTSYITFDKFENLSLPLSYIIRGRYALFNGTLDDAKLYLENARKIKSDMYEAFLLEAEIDLKEGKKDNARAIFISLSSDLGAPEWIRSMAEQFLNNLP